MGSLLLKKYKATFGEDFVAIDQSQDSQGIENEAHEERRSELGQFLELVKLAPDQIVGILWKLGKIELVVEFFKLFYPDVPIKGEHPEWHGIEGMLDVEKF